MNNNNDFKALWNKQKASVIPDAGEIFEKAAQLKRRIRKKLLLINGVLALTVLFILFIVIYYHPQMVTTKTGVAFMILSIVVYLTAANNNIHFLFKGNTENNSNEYLQQLIQLKKKQDFLQTTMLSVYFIFLSLGILLYMIEYAQMMGVMGGGMAYGLTLAWFAFNWFYVRPRTIKKQRAELNAMIADLQRINTQLTMIE